MESNSVEFYVSVQRETTLFRFQYFYAVGDEEQWRKPIQKDIAKSLYRRHLEKRSFLAFIVRCGFNWLFCSYNFAVNLTDPFGNFGKFTLESLQPDTKYALRVAAFNNFTMSEYSEEKVFTTRLGKVVSISFCSSANNHNCNLFLLLSFCIFLLLKSRI